MTRAEQAVLSALANKWRSEAKRQLARGNVKGATARNHAAQDLSATLDGLAAAQADRRAK